MVNLLNKAGVEFAILGREEHSIRDEARRAGNEYLAHTMMTELVQVIKKYHPKKILTACPHSLNILKNEYPRFGVKAEVIHHTQFLAQLIQQGKLKPQAHDKLEIAYHDSCYLDR